MDRGDGTVAGVESDSEGTFATAVVTALPHSPQNMASEGNSVPQ